MVLPRQTLRLSRAVVLNSRSGVNPRLYSSTSGPGENNRAGNPEKSDQAGDVLHQQFAAAKAIDRNPDKTTPLDAAASHRGPTRKPSRGNLSGNAEGVGFVDQVGSQSATADKRTPDRQEGFNGEENITPPSFIDAVKNKLGMKTTPEEDKQNRGGGEGVAGTGKPRFDAKRTLWTSAVNGMPAADRSTSGQAPDNSREPKERTNAEQNPHLKHRSSASAPDDSGKGNAAAEPTLPSHKFNDKKPRELPSVQKSRAFSSSARVPADDKTKHTAESYFKDVDTTPPPSSKTHQVDGSGTGADVQRPHEAPPTGEFSKSGVGNKEYQTVDKRDPYDVLSGQEPDERLRYGGQSNLNDPTRKKDTSQPGEGPEGDNKGGRKPEERS